MRQRANFTRRAFLSGTPPHRHHVSSAVVVTLPARREEIGTHLRAIPGVELHASEGSRIVLTIEGHSSGVLGEVLARISLVEGVISANMVFEHVEELEDTSS